MLILHARVLVYPRLHTAYCVLCTYLLTYVHWILQGAIPSLVAAAVPQHGGQSTTEPSDDITGGGGSSSLWTRLELSAVGTVATVTINGAVSAHASVGSGSGMVAVVSGWNQALFDNFMLDTK